MRPNIYAWPLIVASLLVTTWGRNAHATTCPTGNLWSRDKLAIRVSPSLVTRTGVSNAEQQAMFAAWQWFEQGALPFPVEGPVTSSSSVNDGVVDVRGITANGICAGAPSCTIRTFQNGVTTDADVYLAEPLSGSGWQWSGYPNKCQDPFSCRDVWSTVAYELGHVLGFVDETCHPSHDGVMTRPPTGDVARRRLTAIDRGRVRDVYGLSNAIANYKELIPGAAWTVGSPAMSIAGVRYAPTSIASGTHTGEVYPYVANDRRLYTTFRANGYPWTTPDTVPLSELDPEIFGPATPASPSVAFPVPIKDSAGVTQDFWLYTWSAPSGESFNSDRIVFVGKRFPAAEGEGNLPYGVVPIVAFPFIQEAYGFSVTIDPRTGAVVWGFRASDLTSVFTAYRFHDPAFGGEDSFGTTISTRQSMVSPAIRCSSAASPTYNCLVVWNGIGGNGCLSYKFARVVRQFGHQFDLASFERYALEFATAEVTPSPCIPLYSTPSIAVEASGTFLVALHGLHPHSTQIPVYQVTATGTFSLHSTLQGAALPALGRHPTLGFKREGMGPVWNNSYSLFLTQ